MLVNQPTTLRRGKIGKPLPFTPKPDQRGREGTLAAHLHVIQNGGGLPEVEWLLCPDAAFGTIVLLKFQWRQVIEDGVWHVYMDLEQCHIEGEFGRPELQAVMYHLMDHWTAMPMNVLCGVIQWLKKEAGENIYRPMKIVAGEPNLDMRGEGE